MMTLEALRMSSVDLAREWEGDLPASAVFAMLGTVREPSQVCNPSCMFPGALTAVTLGLQLAALLLGC